MADLNNEIRLITATHLAFYKRHPWLMALFFLGFSLGSALLTAIAGLNQEAKSRYQQSSALISDPVSHLIKPLIGKEFIDGELWVTLKRNGIVGAQPVLRGILEIESGKRIGIQGVDTLLWFGNRQPLTESSNNHASTQPKNETIGQSTPQNDALSLNTLMVDQQYTERLLSESGEQRLFSFQQQQIQPNITFVADIGVWALTDLANADYLLAANGQLSFIELTLSKENPKLLEQQLALIEELIGGQAQLVDANQQNFDVLSEAFFFNLTALAMLGYIVAAFLSFNAIKLTLTARKTLLEQMHLLGCSQTGIKISLSIELIIVSIGTALLGTLGGFLIANGLVLDVNRTLMGLYQLDKALVVNWQWSNVALGFILNIFALLVILLAQSKQVAAKGRLLFGATLLATVLASIWLLNNASTDFQALVLCFCILVFFILLVPKALSAMVSWPFNFTNPLNQWLHADTRFHLKDLHIAIIAILVALGSAIGMQIMVKSFSNTLNAHLEKQLSADIYLRNDDYSSELRAKLEQEDAIKLVSIYQESKGTINSLPATLASFHSDVSHYQHFAIKSGDKVNTRHFENNGCLANEQSQIKFGVTLNSTIEFIQNDKRYLCRISGFFYDYGNPSMMLLTLENRHDDAQFYENFYGYSIRLKNSDSLDSFSEKLINDYQQDSTNVMPNQRFKAFANKLFNDTFMVTKALNGFILAIALLSLCTSLLSLSANQLKQLTILQNLGVTQGQLLKMKLLQTSTIVLFTSLLALPLGFSLGFALLKFVMPIAFGWTIHLSVDISTLLFTCLTLVLVSALCAYMPIRKLTKTNA